MSQAAEARPARPRLNRQPGADKPERSPETTSDGPDGGEFRGGLLSRSFLGLVVTQFLVALNDNMFRWLLLPIGKDLVRTMGVREDLALSAGSVIFLLPFVLLAAPAGYLADRFNKRNVIVGCKLAEIVIMALGIGAILSGNLWLMAVVLFAMGAQSALFSPAKLASIPEIVRRDRIPAANGVMAMTTMVAIISGGVAGGLLYFLTTPEGSLLPPGQHRWWISAAALISVAVVGWVASLTIGPLRAANPSRSFPLNPIGQAFRDLSSLASKRPLMLAALGTAFFWSLGALSQINIDKFAHTKLHVPQQYVGPLLAVLVLGIGVGSVLSGIWSRGRIRLGIVPLAAAVMAVAAMLLYTVPGGPNVVPGNHAYYWSCLWLLILGTAAGLYDIPLQAFLQDRSPEESRGSILAATNLLCFSGMLLASAVFWVLGSFLDLSAGEIFLAAGLLTLPMSLAIAWFVPGDTIRIISAGLVKILYRVRITGLENLPREGGALLAPNHVSWIDGVLLTLALPRPVRMVAYADYVETWWLRQFARDIQMIPIGESRKSMVRSIRTAREALRNGELVCIFPEGGLTRTGRIGQFSPGLLSILKGTDVPVIPVHLGGLWGSIFSFERGKFFWKWPRRWPYPVSIMFGSAMSRPAEARQVRSAVQELEGKAMKETKSDKMVLPRQFLRMCRRRMKSSKAADTSGAELTGGSLLMRTLILRRLLRREVLAPDEPNVGVLLPPSVGGLVTNAALSIDRRVAVNLNYTVSSDVMNICIAKSGIRHVLTSRKVMAKLGLELDAEVVYLEDFKEKITLADKLAGATQAYAMPVAMLERRLGHDKIKPDDLLTIIFTSGSTGEPKGVMLTHNNVASNVESFNQVIHLGDSDVLVGILPFFHSFGYTVTLWTVLTLGPKGIYHHNPMEARPVGKLVGRHGGTILVATPTFLRSYLRRCEPEDFAAMEVVITGAEKLPVDLADAFEEKFGVRPLEGYGTTELSPVVAANIPPHRLIAGQEQGSKEGTVGQPLPGIAAKVVDLDTGEDLGYGKSGMLLVTGPNVMKGYLDQPEKTAEVIRNGWYVTGDIAVIDDEGFIHITGRQSRFSKIGGEMVPHIRIEEALVEVLSLGEEELRVVVSAVPDAKKGERIVVLHTGLTEPPDQICRKLSDAGLPPLWIPSRDSFCQIDELPLLGTGKLDLKQVKELALKKFGG